MFPEVECAVAAAAAAAAKSRSMSSDITSVLPVVASATAATSVAENIIAVLSIGLLVLPLSVVTATSAIDDIYYHPAVSQLEMVPETVSRTRPEASTTTPADSAAGLLTRSFKMQRLSRDMDSIQPYSATGVKLSTVTAGRRSLPGAPLDSTVDAATNAERRRHEQRRFRRFSKTAGCSKTARLTVGLGQTGTLRSVGRRKPDSKLATNGSFRSNGTDPSIRFVTDSAAAAAGDSPPSTDDRLRQPSDADERWKLSNEMSAGDRNGPGQLLPSDFAAGRDRVSNGDGAENLCDTRLHGCPACWIVAEVMVSRRRVSRTVQQTTSDSKESSLGDDLRLGGFSPSDEEALVEDDAAMDDENDEESVPIEIACHLCVNNLLIYEPAFGVDDPLSTLSLTADDMEVALVTSPFQQRPTGPDVDEIDVVSRWNYTSSSSALVIRLSDEVGDESALQNVGGLVCRRDVIVRFRVIEARRLYAGQPGQFLSIESPRFPVGYASGSGDTVTYVIKHQGVTAGRTGAEQRRLAVVFDDWNLTEGTCLDMCDREDITDCLVIHRYCWTDHRPTFVTSSGELYISLSTSADDVIPPEGSHHAMTTASANEPVIGFRATVFFSDTTNSTKKSCLVPTTDCGETIIYPSVDDDNVLRVRGYFDAVRYVDCLWVVRPPTASYLHGRLLQLRIISASVESDIFAISVHDGLTSTSPMLASVWGAVDPRSHAASEGCLEADANDEQFQFLYQQPKQQQTQLLSGTVVLGSRGFYIRMQGIVKPSDNFTFECELSSQVQPEVFDTQPLSSVLDVPAVAKFANAAVDQPLTAVQQSSTADRQQLQQVLMTPPLDNDDVHDSATSRSMMYRITASVRRCYDDATAAGCTQLLMPVGFAVTLLWIAALWVVARLLQRRTAAGRRYFQWLQQQRRQRMPYDQENLRFEPEAAAHRQLLAGALGRCACAGRGRRPFTSGFSRLPTASADDGDDSHAVVFSIARDVTLLSVTSSPAGASPPLPRQHSTSTESDALPPPTYDEVLQWSLQHSVINSEVSTEAATSTAITASYATTFSPGTEYARIPVWTTDVDSDFRPAAI